jgi:hypothetical protein
VSEFIYTEKKSQQYHGPISSTDFNTRVEQNYSDLLYLYNKYGVLDKKLAEIIERVVKENLFLTSAINDLIDRVRALESLNTNQISFYSKSQIDLTPFVGTEYSVSSDQLIDYNEYYNQATLPKVTGSSHSKIKFINATKGQVIPDFLQTRIDNSLSGGDSSGAVIDTTPVQYAFLDQPDKIWRRNVILNEANPLGVSLYLYVKIPLGSVGSSLSNCITLVPYPANGVDVVKVEYTTSPSPSLSDKDVYLPVNPGYYDGQVDAIGKVAPGGWSTLGSDTIHNSGPLNFYFAEKQVTAVRVLLRQKNYVIENSKYVYTYGLSNMDIRYDKFMPTGKTFVKFTAPEGKTINEVTNVIPKIYNVSQSLVPEISSYRVFYPNGDTYSPNSNTGTSSDVYIEISMSVADNKIPPVLSDLIIQADYNL